MDSSPIVHGHRPSAKEPSMVAPDQELPPELSLQEPMAIALFPSVPERVPCAPQPSELSMQKPKAMAPCPSVPRSESCAREPSMTATDQAQPSKLPMREPSAREPSMVAPDQTKPSKLICFVYICALD
ncbi:hypothetical protein BLOT_014531 [Blomia tropicalis]|nr:hypothetical protein BLOT_014531 [Blomia tropicalis]